MNTQVEARVRHDQAPDSSAPHSAPSHWGFLAPVERQTLEAVKAGLLSLRAAEARPAPPSGRRSLGLEPVPVEGCVMCAAFARVRAVAQGVTRQNMNDQLAAHPHRRATDWRQP
ncbi:hypothetical protein ACWGBV_03130 [Streptomyces sp. NPDC055051]